MSRLKKYEQYEGILKEVYHLSKIRKSEEKVDVIDRIKSGQPYSDKVYDFLMQTDLDTVKFVQTVMHMNIATTIVTVSVSTDKCLVSGKILFGIFYAKLLRQFSG